MILDYVNTTKIKNNDYITRRIQEFRTAFNLTGNETPVEVSSKSMTLPERHEYAALTGVVAKEILPVADIDIFSLLGMKKEDGSQRWAMVNPNFRITETNGAVTVEYVSTINTWFGSKEKFCRYHVQDNSGQNIGVISLADKKLYRSNGYHILNYKCPVGGFPILPQRIRDLLKSKAVQDCVMTSVLYQPSGWEDRVYIAPNPDPALLVRKTWDDPWQCVAVWGHDGPNIQEFTS